jgi:AraC-like DNA-binding protein
MQALLLLRRYYLSFSMALLYLTSFIISLLVLLLLSAKKHKQPQDWWLVAWLAVILVNIAGFYVQQVSTYHYFLELSSAVVFLHGPILWSYFQKLVQKSSEQKPVFWPHFIPFALNLVLILPALWEGRLTHLTEVERNLLMVAKLISLLSYNLVTLVHLHLLQRFLPDYFSSTENRKLHWLRVILYSMLALWLVGALNQLAFRLRLGMVESDEDLLLNIAVSLFVLALGYFGFRQGRIFLEPEESVERPPLTTEQPVQVTTGPPGANLARERLLNYMGKERPFLNPELTLPGLAAQLGLSTNELSRLINKELGLNFFDFVNQYRVEEVKRLLQNGEHTRQTLLGIAMDAGFNSKASFNRVFKKLSGRTPTEYISSLPNQAVSKV